MISDSEFPYEYWKEYPERDPQAVVWYPCTYSKLDTAKIWQAPDRQDQGEKEIGFYVHVPFCKSLCKYCPFNKYQWKKEPAQRYLKAVIKEIGMVTSQPYFPGKRVAAGYLGGGTPTCLDTRQLAELLTCCRDRFNIIDGAEMSIEANPDTVDEAKLRTLKELGINRISFGVQSFESRFLRVMGRTHQSRSSIQAIELAQKVGFDVIGIDLMYRIPGQTPADWEKELYTAIRLEVDHITTFSLFLDPGTALLREVATGKAIPQPEQETELTMFGQAVTLLEDSGYSLYSLYDFAKPGCQCLHHAINWQAPQRDYAGFGPGAFSFIHNGENAYIYCNTNALSDYLTQVDRQGFPVDFGKKLTLREEMSRYLVLGVNFLQVPKKPFERQFNISLEKVYGEVLERLNGWGLIRTDEDTIRLTDKGIIYLANVSKAFFTEENRRKPHVIGVELQKGEGRSLGGLEDARQQETVSTRFFKRC